MQRKNAGYLLAGLTAVLTLIIYLPALRNDFVNWDDNIYILDNLRIRSFNTDFLKWAFTDISTDYWLPFAWISHALDYALWGLSPAGHHFTSILIHAANTFIAVCLAIKLIEKACVPEGA